MESAGPHPPACPPPGGVVVFAVNSLLYLNQSVPPYGVALNSLTTGTTAFPLRECRGAGAEGCGGGGAGGCWVWLTPHHRHPGGRADHPGLCPGSLHLLRQDGHLPQGRRDVSLPLQGAPSSLAGGVGPPRQLSVSLPAATC